MTDNTKSAISDFELVGSKPHYNPDKKVSTNHISLDLALDFENKALVGTSTLDITIIEEGLKSLQIDACEMKILEVRMAGKKTTFEHDGKQIFIDLKKPHPANQSLQVSVDYFIEKPKVGISFIAPDQNYPDKPVQVWTQGESEGSRYWFPCFDFVKQICTVELKARIPENFTGLSNGVLLEEKKLTKADEKLKKLELLVSQKNSYKNYKLVHWSQDIPHPVYLTAFTAGDFAVVKDKWKGLEVNYYSAQKNKDLLKLTAEKTPRMIEFLSKKLGYKYPWKKYHQVWVHDFIWGGMENTTLTINTERALVDERAKQDYIFGEMLIIHELAHQWFGDLVVIDHWSHLWTKEGAVTYCEQLWWEHEYGWEEFQYYRLQEQREYLKDSYQRPVVTNVYRHVEDLYDRHSYTKAGTIFHMIRTVLGEKTFELFLQTYIQDNEHKNVEALDVLRAIEKVSGKNLKWLFDQYLFGAGHPEFEISYSWDNDKNLAKLGIVQKQALNKKQNKNIFNISIPISFNYIQKGVLESTSISIDVEKEDQTFYFPLEKKPDFISFDTSNNYLKTVELKYPINELEKQLSSDPDPISRIYAATAIAKLNTLQALEILEKAFKKESFWAVRAEIGTQVGNLKIYQAQDSLLKFIKDSDARVQRSIITALSGFKTEEVFKALEKVYQNDDLSYFAEGAILKNFGLIAKSLGLEAENKAIIILKDALENKQGWNEVVRSSAVAGLSQMNGNEEALNFIIEQTKVGVSQELRQAALGVLGMASKNQTNQQVERILDILENAASEDYIFYEHSIITSLVQIPSSKSIYILKKIGAGTIFARTERKVDEAVETISKQLKDRTSIEELRKQIEQIQKENIELRGKVEEIAAVKKKKPTK
jgi:aminopeptidase N